MKLDYFLLFISVVVLMFAWYQEKHYTPTKIYSLEDKVLGYTSFTSYVSQRCIQLYSKDGKYLKMYCGNYYIEQKYPTK